MMLAMRDLGNGITFWQGTEVGLPPQTAPSLDLAQVVDHFGHYTTGEELGRDDVAAWMREIERFHRVTMGWEHGFAYCWAVARDPNPQRAHLIEVRGYRQGGHTRDHNRTSVATVFLGDDDPEYADLTPGVKRALRFSFDMADLHIGRALNRKPHRAVSATACPGNEMTDWMAAGMPVEAYPGVPGATPLPKPPEPVPNIPPPKATMTRPRPTLQRGSYGDQVVALQQALNVFSAGLVVDGVFGRRTRHALMNFQRFWRIDVDGVYGKYSAKHLDGALTLAGR